MAPQPKEGDGKEGLPKKRVHGQLPNGRQQRKEEDNPSICDRGGEERGRRARGEQERRRGEF